MESQAVRDLRWVLETPSLIDDPQAIPSTSFDATLADPDELEAFLSERVSHRVGRYFESLVLFWLERIRKVEIVAQGHQIREGNRTIGEIDFLFHDEDGRLNHWEAAVKFFLHYPRVNGSHFPGPNATDDFERKAAKLFDKQLPLSEKHFPIVEIRRAFTRGMLFYHPDVGEPKEFPDRLNSQHQRGEWIRSSELDRLERMGSCSIAILRKPTWLASPQPERSCPSTNAQADLQQHFANSEFPVMLSIFDPTGEVRRMFVVPDCWPTS